MPEQSGLPRYKIHFYRTVEGIEPVRRWLSDLPIAVRGRVGFLMKEYLQHLGPDVVETRFGKNLGGGLCEFRLDEEVEGEKALFRIFFHVYADKIVLLLHAYDKGERPAADYQNRMISVARQRLRDFQQRMRS